jgi:hypothetical protein
MLTMMMATTNGARLSLWRVLVASWLAMGASFVPSSFLVGRKATLAHSSTLLFMSDEGGAPSDYDSGDLSDPEKTVAVDMDEDDSFIRDTLKRELLLLAAVTDRGEYASPEERDIIIDLVTQLEALNPTPDPASMANCEGEWDLCMSSTQFFRSSPFFQTIRAAMGDDNKSMAETGFDIHDRATTASRVGRVRQTISPGKLISEVDLEVGVLPGFPVRVKGDVITSASLEVVGAETWETKIESTKVKGSNVPFLNQYLDSPTFELPVGTFYNTVLQKVPVVQLKTFYVDEGMRITRDVDDNFFVFTRA